MDEHCDDGLSDDDLLLLADAELRCLIEDLGAPGGLEDY